MLDLLQTNFSYSELAAENSHDGIGPHSKFLLWDPMVTFYVAVCHTAL